MTIKPVIWETPRKVAVLAASAALVAGVLGGLVGYEIGSTPERPIVIYVTAPAK